MQLNVHKSMDGLDISLGIRREMAHVVANLLSIIFEKSWLSGEVPGDWKREALLPFLRKGERKDPGNYRLVNLTSVPGKIMEHILLETMLRHI